MSRTEIKYTEVMCDRCLRKDRPNAGPFDGENTQLRGERRQFSAEGGATMPIDIDLCSDCSRAFHRWVHNHDPKGTE